MFTYNAQDLNKEYRNRQAANARQQQLANEIPNNQPVINLNISRKAIISVVVTVIVALIFFISGGDAAAQDSTSFSGGDASDGAGGGLEVLYLAVGVDALMSGDFDKAMRCFEDSLEANPEYVATYAARAMLHIIQGDLDAALSDALAGYEIDPESAEIHFVLGAIYYETGQFEDARSHYETYLAMVTAAESEPALMTAMFAGNGVALAQAQIASANEYLLAVGG
jgi:tetratricopeptide (TPR) repeat protein